MKDQVTYDFSDEYMEQDVTKSYSLCVKITCVLFGVIILLLICTFVIFPVIFMHCIQLQRLFMFMNVNLPSSQDYYSNFKEKGYRNLYVAVKDEQTNETLTLGVWHLLPHNLTNASIADKNYDYDAALASKNFSVILYFHGIGESRSYCTGIYHVLRNVSHVIAFDYRNFADSTKAILSEDAVVNDSVQVYKWLLRKTNSSIYVWGHSLGTALATRTVSILKDENVVPKGLFLESPFTSMREELPVHKYGKFFAWLPWFNSTILEPLYRNGFRFDTAKHILKVDCPIMIMHAEDDSVVPYTLGLKLYHIAMNERNLTQGRVIYYQFAAALRYDHFRIYKEPLLPCYIRKFMNVTHYAEAKKC